MHYFYISKERNQQHRDAQTYEVGVIPASLNLGSVTKRYMFIIRVLRENVMFEVLQTAKE
jgi:hypothetical protein